MSQIVAVNLQTIAALILGGQREADAPLRHKRLHQNGRKAAAGAHEHDNLVQVVVRADGIGERSGRA